MAQINLKDIQRIEKIRNIVHEKVHTTYTVFQSDGEKYIQLDTYGRVGRENPENSVNRFNWIRKQQVF